MYVIEWIQVHTYDYIVGITEFLFGHILKDKNLTFTNVSKGKQVSHSYRAYLFKDRRASWVVKNLRQNRP